MRNIKMTIRYDGSRYKGFQRLKDNDMTIQGKIEDVLSKMANESIEIIGSGRTDMGVQSDNPFTKIEDILEEIKGKADYIVVDFHAEATAEKIAMKHFLDGKVTFLFGTHTHVQTADEEITKKGTAYITDIGMTGPKKSVIGMDVDTSVKRFYTTLPERYKVSSDSNQIMNSVLLSINDETCRVEKIERINL